MHRQAPLAASPPTSGAAASSFMSAEEEYAPVQYVDYSTLAGEPVPSIRRKPLASPTSPPITSTQSQSQSQTQTQTQTEPKRYTAVYTVNGEDSNGESDKPHVNNTRPGLAAVLGIWKWELVSLIISIASFVAIVIVLRVYENKSVSKWKLPISVNAIIAILSALFKGALALPIAEGIGQLKWLWFSKKSSSLADLELFDRASRGPWGSLILIGRQFVQRRRSYLASLGAFVAIIALATDPFSQASVSLTSCLRNSTEPTTIPRANNYLEVGGHDGAVKDTASKAMQLALYLGIIQPPRDSAKSVQVACKTGNCTYGADQDASFTTLTMCHSCKDLTHDIESHNHSGVPQSILSYDDVKLQVGLSVLLDLATFETDDYSSERRFPDGVWNRTSVADLQGLAMVFKDPNCPPDRIPLCEMKPFAFRCGLQPCVKTYKADFSNGEYHEKEISRELLHYIPPARKFELALNRTFYNGAWRECKPSKTKTDTNTEQVSSPQSQAVSRGPHGVDYSAFPTLWYTPECVYIMGAGAAQGFAASFGDLLNNNTLQFYNLPGGLEGAIWLQAMWNLGNLTMNSLNDYMNGVSIAVGAEMRQHEATLLKAESGQALQLETCIHVRWKFLSFLAVLLVLALVFFMGILFVNLRSAWGADWKSSPLALVFQNVGQARPPHPHESAPELERSLRQEAMATKVTFAKVDGRWQLCRDY